MNKAIRNTYSDDLVLERLKRERAKTASKSKPKKEAPFWVWGWLGSSMIATIPILSIVGYILWFCIKCWMVAWGAL